MKIAVTGGTGFIGAPLVAALLAAGHRVRLLSRHPPQRLPDGAEFTAFDAEKGLDPEALEGCGAVFHLAGESISKRWTQAQKRRVLDSRVRGTDAIARGVVAAKVPTLVSTSATGYYGDRGDEVLTEDSGPGEGFLSDVCKAWEAALEPARAANVRTSVIRVGIVLHPSGGALARMALPVKLGVGGKLGPGNQWMSWIHRDDLVSLYLHALDTPGAAGVFNGTSPEPVANVEMTRALGRVLHRPTLFPVPAVALRLALGQMSELVLDSNRVLPQRTLASGFAFRFPTLGAALSDLYTPTRAHTVTPVERHAP